MPTYDYWCPACGRPAERRCEIAKRDAQECGCGSRLRRVLSAPRLNLFGEREFWLEGARPEGRVVVRSKRQLHEECRKRGKVVLGEMEFT